MNYKSTKKQKLSEFGFTYYKNFNTWDFHSFCRVFVQSQAFTILIFIMIIINTIFSAIATHLEVIHDGQIPDFFNIAEIFFLTIYSLEIVLRFFSSANWRNYFNFWNIFDLFIVILSILPFIGKMIDFSYLRGFRALRALRALKSFRIHRRLELMLRSLFVTMKSAISIVFIFFIFILICAIFAYNQFGKLVEDPWGKLERGLLYILAIATKDSWNMPQVELDEKYGEGSRYFISFVLVFLGIIFSSLVIAAVTDSYSATSEEEYAKILKKRKSNISKYIENSQIEEEKRHDRLLRESISDSIKISRLIDTDVTDPEFLKMLKEIEKADTKRSLFTNPAWMKSVALSLEIIQQYNLEKQKLHQEMLEHVMHLSDFTKNKDRRKHQEREKETIEELQF
ncbi:putative: cation channel, sperm associated 1-like protein [Tritrichomonas foetus]|uniref:Putative: cation channel, sperm associated 1-like protein n=1 Tax=Tritrichomonas foetus TaxID=1144522 RepID=A0A1J4L4R9_9EUKA|nr:putative: cation channel, sperm associated 1-like protein [Tritrichomonas foetus]|eukprot:OHT16925.1 putative: cation channel, sperm associated 1-like protein [Tritrichomonas foetus]